ncbi:Uncharacterised protein [Escherichia coli]|nr:structure protein [Escherichia coli DEC7B]STH33269.1 Uncharacterised protein [Escherichia coli]
MKKYVTTKSVQPVAFRLTTLSLVMSAVLGSASVIAGEKLDMSFIQGGAGLIRKSGQP